MDSYKWDKNSAEAHWGDPYKPYTILIESMVHVSQVDWESTFILNLNPTLGEAEKEIRLPEGIPLKIISLYNTTKKQFYKLDKISKITFPA